MAEDDGIVSVLVTAAGGVMVVTAGVAGELTVVDGELVVLPLSLPLPPPAAGDAGVVADDDSATLTLNFIPPPQWPTAPQMK